MYTQPQLLFVDPGHGRSAQSPPLTCARTHTHNTHTQTHTRTHTHNTHTNTHTHTHTRTHTRTQTHTHTHTHAHTHHTHTQGFPTIKFFYVEGDKIKSSDYNGQRATKDFINFAFDKAKVSAEFVTAGLSGIRP